ncbi:MAG: hypothetical protein DMG24_23515 [Acidobacteria bacterium]|nr:MAG: hypothetical protein DMG24_23515 [Acidobacteriota bacterium]
MGALWQDLRYGFRMLTKNGGFTAVAVITLALGIGANTAIFSIVYGVMLKPLPFADASRLVAIESMTGHDRGGTCPRTSRLGAGFSRLAQREPRL